VIKVLNGLRGYAAVFVVLAHMPQMSSSSLGEFFSNLLSFSRIAYISVDIFFVLSGFLITRNLLKELKKTDFISFKSFYFKRFLRLFPIYYLTLILVWIFIDNRFLLEAGLYLQNYTFSFYFDPHPLRHTWSLAVEEHFYLFWPLLVLFLHNKKNSSKIIISISLIFAVFSTIIFMIYFEEKSVIYLISKSSNTRFLSLACGGLLAYHENSIRCIKHNYRFLGYSIFMLSIAVFSRLVFNPGIIYALCLYLFSFSGCILLFIFVLNLEEKRSVFNKVFTNKFIVLMGAISYSLYLYHYPIFYLFGMTNKQMFHNNVDYFEPSYVLMVVLLCFVVALLSYYLIEKPLMKLKNKV
tara:strand:+ start:2671 stop:3729 length:1059 start_codon:yes stop_codon:yes gene_type:complete